MNSIENIYTDYSGILEEFTEEVVNSRYAAFYQEIQAFAKSLEVADRIQIDESVLTHAVMDYFTDISRLKKFHQIKHINSLKAIAYESYWLLRRKPIQIVGRGRLDDSLVFINEKFAFSRITKYMLGDGRAMVISEAAKKGFMNYLDSFFYFLKYRDYDAQVIEMMIMGFKAGLLVADDLKR